MSKRMGSLLILVVGFAPPALSETFAWWRFEDGTPGEAVAQVKDFGEDGLSEGPSTGGNPMGGVLYGVTDHGMDINDLPDRVALDLDGFDDFIPDIPFRELTLFDNFTVEAIVLWRGVVDPQPEGKRLISMILQQQDGSGTGRSLLYIIEVEEPDPPDVIPTLASFLGGGATELEGVEVPANQWIYVGFTYSGFDGLITLWMDTDITDGINPAENHVTGLMDFEDNDAPMIIGRHKSLIDNFHGMISELRITDSGFGSGPEPENPPENHLQATPAVNTNVEMWALF